MNGLSDRELQGFLEKGYLVVPGCFKASAAANWVAKARKRLAGAPRDPQTWYAGRGMLNAENSVMVKDFSPKAWMAIGALAGSPERLSEGEGLTWNDCFVIQFPSENPRDWQGPSPRFPGNWHMDGDESPRFLDSADVGMLCFVFWSSVKTKGGGTFIACDSIGHVARYLADKPQGVLKSDIPVMDIISRCKDFVELTGKPGDVVLMHPFMLHAESLNAADTPRFLTAKSIALKQPPEFDRAKAGDYSPIESAVLRALGVEKLKFRRRPARTGR